MNLASFLRPFVHDVPFAPWHLTALWLTWVLPTGLSCLYRPGLSLLTLALLWRAGELQAWSTKLACIDSPIPWQEIPLSEILAVEPAQNFSLVPPGTNPHCFEIITANVTYFVGETPGGAPGGPSGQGTEAVRGWETAIRQALMPVILQDAPTAPGHTPHSKSPLRALEKLMGILRTEPT